MFQFLQNFLDVIIPLNDSREHDFVYSAEYFRSETIFLSYFNGLLAACMGAVAVISTGCMLAGCILHICAMLNKVKIANKSYKIIQ